MNRHHTYSVNGRKMFRPKTDCDKEQNCQRAGSSDCQRCTWNRNHKTDYFQPAVNYPYWYWWYYQYPNYPYRHQWYPDMVVYCGNNDGHDDVSWGTAVTYTSSGGGTETSMTPREAIDELYEDLYLAKE